MGTKQYGYDNTYQLTSAQYEHNQAFTWAYDAAGNRVSSVEPDVSNTYVKNSLNQCSSVNGISYTYYADGNLLSDGTRTITWDIRNRLSTVVTGEKTISYGYDHNDLRVSRNVTGAGLNQTTNYYFDGSLMLCEKDGIGKTQKVYINDGTGIIGMVRYIYKDDGTFDHYSRLYYMFDSLGSVTALTGENGKPVTEYNYTPYGKAMNANTDVVNNLLFVGKYGGYLDWDTGLTYFWHRWYDAGNGRWENKDPIGLKGGINLYKYSNNRPLTMIDWKGLEAIVPFTFRPEILPIKRGNEKCNNTDNDNCYNSYKQCRNNAAEMSGMAWGAALAAFTACSISCGVSCADSTLGAVPCMTGCCNTFCTPIIAVANEFIAATYADELLDCETNFYLCKKGAK